ncbi:histone chaperone, partial [Mycena belliarum]
RVTFDCIASLCVLSHRGRPTPHRPPDLEWKLIYVSAGNEELDDCLVGPVPAGVNSFDFKSSPPDFSKIPAEDNGRSRSRCTSAYALGAAALILTGSYKDQELVVGYYQSTEYENEEMTGTPPAGIMVRRNFRRGRGVCTRSAAAPRERSKARWDFFFFFFFWGGGGGGGGE